MVEPPRVNFSQRGGPVMTLCSVWKIMRSPVKTVYIAGPDISQCTPKRHSTCSLRQHVRSAIVIARAVTAFLLLHGAWRMEAQTPPTSKPAPTNHDPLNRDTPRSSVFSFLEACRAKDYEQAWRYLDLRRLDDNK